MKTTSLLGPYAKETTKILDAGLYKPTIMPPTPNTARPITAENSPQFPCWLWHAGNHLISAQWQHSSQLIQSYAISPYTTHWHPDQPTAPTCVPGAESVASDAKWNNTCVRQTPTGLELNGKLIKATDFNPTDHKKTATDVPDWTMRAASEVVAFGQPTVAEAARIIARHAPAASGVTDEVLDAFRDIAAMPKYDQDDAHRLREKGRNYLKRFSQTLAAQRQTR